MNFASDNVAGASPRVLQAIMQANAGAAPSYGADPWTQRAETLIAELFEREVSVFLVPTGTAANALALASLCPPWGAVLTHAESHINTDECGAPEAFSGGAKLVVLPGRSGKLEADALEAAIGEIPDHPPHNVQPKAVSFSQATEAGTVYTAAETARLADVAHARGLAVHVDGARFANALVATRASPAELTWKAGVDVLSLGLTKGGALAAEAAVFFDPALAETMQSRRKRQGHLLSKGRLLGAQVCAMLEGGHWLDLARHANVLAARLAEGLVASAVARLAAPVEANEIFPVLSRALHDRLQAAGAVYYEWPSRQLRADADLAAGEVLVRLVTSWTTTEAEVDAFLDAIRRADVAA